MWGRSCSNNSDASPWSTPTIEGRDSEFRFLGDHIRSAGCRLPPTKHTVQHKSLPLEDLPTDERLNEEAVRRTLGAMNATLDSFCNLLVHQELLRGETSQNNAGSGSERANEESCGTWWWVVLLFWSAAVVARRQFMREGWKEKEEMKNRIIVVVGSCRVVWIFGSELLIG